jgi:tRNA-specific 2-thiouridylase
VADDDHGGFVDRLAGDRAPPSGEIVSLDGLSLGRHRGVHRYTVGQRRGLGIASPEPYFVVSLDADRSRVVVGRRADVHSQGVVAEDPSWLASPPEIGDRIGVRIRYRHGSSAARVVARDGSGISLRFEEPQLAVAPGQQLAFYDGERVLGAATITAALDEPHDAALESSHG